VGVNPVDAITLDSKIEFKQNFFILNEVILMGVLDMKLKKSKIYPKNIAMEYGILILLPFKLRIDLI
tara:strand:- start:24 stop:224 length:201 start_codon:yes stop_codon:yes gene_type:complete